ncbi:MAG: S26 family signal peptidase [Candidatus Nanopelagicaceae bacterium]|nr:S26 family signal peptidase [Candidatus Nanopelagicaceae bacterium]
MRIFGALGSNWPYRLVKVSGNSMEPTFNDGDVLLVKWFLEVEREIPLGSNVVIERDEMPGVFLIKRIQKSHSGLYWVEGDNRNPETQKLMNDSRKWGYISAHEVKAKVQFRIRKN